MLEWVPIIGSIIKAVDALRKETKEITTDVNDLIEKKTEGAALIDIATLRFNSNGMKAIVEKTKEGVATQQDFSDLSDKLTSSIDDVTVILMKLAYEKEYGSLILKRRGLETAAQFQDKVMALKSEIRNRLGGLGAMDPKSNAAMAEAGEISKLIETFNADLVRLHGAVFGHPKAVQNKGKPPKEANPSKEPKKATKGGRT